MIADTLVPAACFEHAPPAAVDVQGLSDEPRVLPEEAGVASAAFHGRRAVVERPKLALDGDAQRLRECRDSTPGASTIGVRPEGNRSDDTYRSVGRGPAGAGLARPGTGAAEVDVDPRKMAGGGRPGIDVTSTGGPVESEDAASRRERPVVDLLRPGEPSTVERDVE